MPGELRTPFIFLDPLAEGNSALRVPFLFLDPLSEGYRNLRVPFVFLESLFPLQPEPHMLSTPFPGFGNNTSNPAVPAAADPASSSLPGLAFSVHKIPLFNTNLDEAASGNEIATSLTQYPRWKYELTYDHIEDSSGANSSLKKIMGFFLQCRGRFQTWLFKDPDDYLVTAGQCGTADGVTTQFYFCRTLGGFVEPVGQVDQANTIHVSVNGVLKTPVTDYNIVMPNKIVFVSAPASGPITADFQFFFVCRFLDDEKDYEKFADKLWNLNTCEFRSVIQQ